MASFDSRNLEYPLERPRPLEICQKREQALVHRFPPRKHAWHPRNSLHFLARQKEDIDRKNRGEILGLAQKFEVI